MSRPFSSQDRLASLQGRLAEESPLIPLTSAADVEDGDDGEECEFIESMPVAALIALMPRAIAALSDQARIGADGEPLDGRSPALLATNVDLAIFNSLLSSETRPKVSLSYDATSGSIHIYELPKDGHDQVSREIAGFFFVYSGAQGGRRVPPSSGDFQSLGSTDVSLGPHGNRQPDESFRATASVHAEPVLVVEICHAQPFANGDARAQAWLRCDVLGYHVQAVLVIKYWPRRRNGTFAAVAALYEQGGGPGADRTVNLVPPPDDDDPVAAAAVYVPGVPPVPAPGAAAGAAQRAAPAGFVAVAPIAPTRVVSFGTAPPGAGAAMEGVRGLGTTPEGFGFDGGLCDGAACDAIGVPGYTLRVPAARLYFGVPPGILPAGVQLDQFAPNPVNDFRLDLFAISAVLSVALPI